MSRPKVLHIDKNHHLLLEGLESLGYKNVLAYDTPLSILLPKLKEYCHSGFKVGHSTTF